MLSNVRPIPFDSNISTTTHDSYRRMLGLSPVLSLRVSQILAEWPKWGASVEEIEKLTLPDNASLPPERSVEMSNEHLRSMLASLREMLGSEPVIFVRDECFTNDLLKGYLVKIVWGEEAYSRYVFELFFDYSNPPSDEALQRVFPGKRIVLIWGSESDTDTIHPDMYSNHLAKCLRESFSGSETSPYCHYFLTVCFGSQYAANIIGAECWDSLCVPATMRWPAQFWPSPCRISNLETQNERVQSVFSGLCSARGGGRVSLQFTRTGYVEPNFFSSKGESYLIPLVTDEVTWWVVGWADRRSHRIFGMQAHPEIPLNPDSVWLRTKIKGDVRKILDAIRGGYGEGVLSLEDQFFPDFPVRNPGESFYSHALSALSDELFYSLRPDVFSDYAASQIWMTDFDGVLSGYQWYLSLESSLLSDLSNVSSTLRQSDYLRSVDKIGKVELLCHADWKVWRWIASYGEVSWIDMDALLKEQERHVRTFSERPDFLTFNDFWAGNGTFLSEMREKYELEKRAFFYGVGDRIYFDLYQGICRHAPHVPERVRMAFVQEVIRRYLRVSPTVKPTLRSKFSEILKGFSIDPEIKIDFSSMFSSWTVMFSGEAKIPLSEAEKSWITEHGDGILRTLAERLSNDPYPFIEGSFDRISLADFRDYSMPEWVVPKEDLRVSIRGTSHLDAGDLSAVLDRFARKEAALGAVFVDNGVHRSYTSVPRLREYLALERAYPGQIRVTMICDFETNYFCSAVIERAPFHGADFFSKIGFVRKNPETGQIRRIIPVPVEEAESHPFFRFERFFRDFLVSNFRSYEIFWFFNEDIVSFLKDAVYLLAEGKRNEIKSRFVKLVERFCLQLNEKAMDAASEELEILYVPITGDDLDAWSSKEGETIESILETPYFSTDWFNPDGKRRY